MHQFSKPEDYVDKTQIYQLDANKSIWELPNFSQINLNISTDNFHSRFGFMFLDLKSAR